MLVKGAPVGVSIFIVYLSPPENRSLYSMLGKYGLLKALDPVSFGFCAEQ